MLEQIIPIAKYTFFNFEYFLIVGLLLIWLLIKLKPNLYLSQKIINFGDIIYNGFIRLTQIKPIKLLLIFFIINLMIRFLMALPVPDISLDKLAPHYLNLAQSLYQGEGFTTHVIWNNFLQHPQIVRPDFFRLPLYPFLISLSYKIFGVSYFAAKLVNVVTASLLPIIAYLFAWVLTKSKRIATLTLIFICFNLLLISWTALAWPEFVYCLCAILALYFLFRTKNKVDLNPVLVGVFWALAYLSRAEILYVFLPVILFFYFYKQGKKQFVIKTLLTFFGFIIIALPYLARNYVITGNPIYSDFDRIMLVGYLHHGYLIESISSEYQNIFDLFFAQPWLVIKTNLMNLYAIIISIPKALLSSYIIGLASLIGIITVWQKEKSKYYFLFLAIILNIVIISMIEFTDRYLIILIILLYLFASIGIFKLIDDGLGNKKSLKSLLSIYLLVFITFGTVVGIGQGTLPYIPHSFYERFDADKYFTELEEFYGYVKDNTAENDVVMASRRPYEVYYFTNRPTILFPFATTEEIQEFMKKYQVKWVIWMGTPKKVDGNYYRFWLPEEIPENIKPVFKNTGGDLFKVEYYID